MLLERSVVRLLGQNMRGIFAAPSRKIDCLKMTRPKTRGRPAQFHKIESILRSMPASCRCAPKVGIDIVPRDVRDQFDGQNVMTYARLVRILANDLKSAPTAA